MIISMRMNKKSGLKKIDQRADFSVCFFKIGAKRQGW